MSLLPAIVIQNEKEEEPVLTQHYFKPPSEIHVMKTDAFKRAWIAGEKAVCDSVIETIFGLIGESRKIFVPEKFGFLRYYYPERNWCRIEGRQISLSETLPEGFPWYIYRPSLGFRLSEGGLEIATSLIEHSRDSRDLTNSACQNQWTELFKGAIIAPLHTVLTGHNFYLEERGIYIKPPNKLADTVEGLRKAAITVAEDIIPYPFCYSNTEYAALIKETSRRALEKTRA